jgi:hypothetical protein
METYRPELWRDLYVMLGTSSAALLGLLFVVTSLHLDDIVNNPGYRRHARSNSVYLIMTLVEAALILTPQPIWSLGAEVIAINGFGLMIPINNLYFIYKNRSSARRGGFAVYRSYVFIASFLAGIAGGIGLAIGAEWGLYLVTAAYVSLLVSVSLNSWSIMLGVGEMDRKAKASRSAAVKERK